MNRRCALSVKHLIGRLLALCLLECGAAVSMGQSPPPGPDGPGGRRFTDIELTEEFDANQDGRLDRPERDAAGNSRTLVVETRSNSETLGFEALEELSQVNQITRTSYKPLNS